VATHSERTLPRALRRAGEGEGGFTLLELVVALSLLAMVAVGFSLTVGSGFRTIAVARQRQTAADILSARIEHLRNIPYAEVALSSQPAHADDETDPDSFVSTDGLSFDVTGDGDFEPLIVDTGAGAVLHFEDPVKVSTTVMRIYQYVTWVDDPDVAGPQNYRRVTVVAQFHAPAENGVNQIVRMSSLFTPAGIVIGGSPTTTTSTTAPPGTTTTTAPSSTTTTPAACPGDTAGPTGTFSISSSSDAEVGYTAAANVTAKFVLTDSCTPVTVQLSNDGTAFGASVAYVGPSMTLSWALDEGDGTKTVTARATDGAGNVTTFSPVSIVLDETKPLVPGTLNRTVGCSGSNRTVNLTWGASIDTNLRGYRVYKSTDGVTWSAIDTASSFSYTDTHKKSLDSVRFYVVAYDRAGNESDATNVVSLAKNQCG
jgi:prepilin-type N-terminal cleavage/methylation domain-containing protein